jgi:type II secretory pathway pseudopilin PulG
MDHLKTNNEQSRQCGTTLIELSVVIAVLLLLVAVLFIGASAWKSGANTAACIMNLASIQKAARGYASMNGLNIGTALTAATLTSAGFWSTLPSCPTSTAYTGMATVPSVGVQYAVCPVVSHTPAPALLANW